jgi:hypothetical protein
MVLFILASMTWLPKVHLGVIDDARRRQHRRWAGIGAGLAVVAVALVLVLDRPAVDHPAAPARATGIVPPSKLLSRDPYMGVACSAPNSTACGRVGLAVWLKRPAKAVDAEVNGHHLSLKLEMWATRRASPFVGYLRGAQANFRLPEHWEGQPPRDGLVRLRIDYGRGRSVETRVRVELSPGWG